MREITSITAWDRLLKKIVWKQLGNVEGKRILDFGSGQGIMADYYAACNEVVAIEPNQAMLADRWQDHSYIQLIGSIECLKQFEDETFDLILVHNVLEYIEIKEGILEELTRVLKKGGIMSIVKHNRNGRVMQMAVLLDRLEEANDLLDGKDSTAKAFGTIHYYSIEELISSVPDMQVKECYGIRTFYDLQQNQEKHSDESWQDRMVELELRVSTIPEFQNIAFFHHYILEKYK